MVNEAKTEGIVRKILEKHKDKYEQETDNSVIIEEKQSDNPIISKLLKSASKKGGAQGIQNLLLPFQTKNY